jgi:hypothetical protein
MKKMTTFMLAGEETIIQLKNTKTTKVKNTPCIAATCNFNFQNFDNCWKDKPKTDKIPARRNIIPVMVLVLVIPIVNETNGNKKNPFI